MFSLPIFRGLTRTAAREWGRYGITANVINPAIASDALKSFVANQPDRAEQAVQAIPMRRYGDIYADGGRLAVFLASDDASFLTGMTFQADEIGRASCRERVCQYV